MMVGDRRGEGEDGPVVNTPPTPIVALKFKSKRKRTYSLSSRILSVPNAESKARRVKSVLIRRYSVIAREELSGGGVAIIFRLPCHSTLSLTLCMGLL